MLDFLLSTNELGKTQSNKCYDISLVFSSTSRSLFHCFTLQWIAIRLSSTCWNPRYGSSSTRPATTQIDSTW